MKKMMDLCVNRVIELYEEQVDRVRSEKNRRVKVSKMLMLYVHRQR